MASRLLLFIDPLRTTFTTDYVYDTYPFVSRRLEFRRHSPRSVFRTVLCRDYRSLIPIPQTGRYGKNEPRASKEHRALSGTPTDRCWTPYNNGAEVPAFGSAGRQRGLLSPRSFCLHRPAERPMNETGPPRRNVRCRSRRRCLLVRDRRRPVRGGRCEVGTVVDTSRGSWMRPRAMCGARSMHTMPLREDTYPP